MDISLSKLQELVMVREAWHVAVHGSQRVGHDWVTELILLPRNQGTLVDLDFFFLFISWRLITLQYCCGFVIHWHESAMDVHVFPIPIPSPTSLSTRSLWIFPVYQVWALVSCIQLGLVICFTLDNIHVSMLFSWNIPPSPSPTESKSLFYTSVSLFLVLHIGLSLPSSKFHIYVLVYYNGLYFSGLIHSV